MNWKDQLASMKGKSFVRHGQPEGLVNYVIHSDEQVEILTNVDDYTMPASEVAAFLESFELTTTRPAKRTPTGPAPFVATVSDTSKLQLMQDALMNTLKRVQADESYVPQAEQVSKLVQVGINLARLELDAIRLSRA